MSLIEKEKKIRADWSQLNEQQRTMIRHYLRSGSKIDSYMTAYKPDLVDDKEERRKSQRSCYDAFKRPHIAVIIKQIQEVAIRKAGIQYDDIVNEQVNDMISDFIDINAMQADALWVLRRAMMLADFNIRKFLRKEEDGRMIYDFSNATEEDWYCIQEYTVEQLNVNTDKGAIPADKIKIKTVDKLKALEMVGKHINIQAFRDSVELVGNRDEPLRHITKEMTPQEAAEAYKDTLSDVESD